MIQLTFAFGIIFESILAILQFFHQGSLNGLFYFFGERMFSSTTPGIANASINGELIMRPYATFSHPNVLAGYLVIGMTIIISNFKFQMSNVQKVLLISSVTVGTIALFLTLSRVAILVWVCVSGFLFFKNFRGKIQKTKYLLINTMLASFVILISVFSPILPRFTGLTPTDESVILREQSDLNSFRMMFTHPLLGVGLNNYLPALPCYISYEEGSGFHPFLTLQPVHNIFLLLASETGFVGFWITVSFVIWVYIRLNKRYRQCERLERSVAISTGLLRHSIPHNDTKNEILLSILLLTEVVLLGNFDHYFLTLQQGQLLLGLVLGICMANVNSFKSSSLTPSTSSG